MDEFGLPIVGTGIDYTQVEPLDKKKLLTYINHYVINTVGFLNKFSSVCERKMMDLETKLDNLELTLNILETKLSSIPGLEGVTVTTTAQPDQPAAQTQPTASQPPAAETQQPTQQPTATAQQPAQPEPEPAAAPEPDVPKVSQDPRYMKFFKMLNFGVPNPAIKLKMVAEGLIPDYLDTPDAPAPSGGGANSDSSQSEYESDDFSD